MSTQENIDRLADKMRAIDKELDKLAKEHDVIISYIICDGYTGGTGKVVNTTWHGLSEQNKELRDSDFDAFKRIGRERFLNCMMRTCNSDAATFEGAKSIMEAAKKELDRAEKKLGYSYETTKPQWGNK